ncbi:MAG: hypothetical protein ACE37F_28690 [Nannocystaceae bacterium]|nr:hypothetical protein [bacterium]
MKKAPLVAGLALGVMASFVGCRGEDLSFDCENQAMNFLRTVDAEDRELRDIPDNGPFPVTMTITEDSLNRLVAGVIDDEVPFAGSVPFGVLPEGPGEAEFEANDVPVVIVRDVAGCRKCVVLRVSFGVRLDQEGDPLSSGSGFADIAVPLELEANEEEGTTVILANYSEAFIDDWYLSVYGFDSDKNETLAGALKLLMTEEIQANFEPLPLFNIGSWEIGRGQVKMATRKVFVQGEQQRIVLGLSTNLTLPEGAGLDVEAPLPEDVAIGVSMDPILLDTMARRMMEEGEIPTRYDEDGNADDDGIYAVSINEIEAGVAGNNLNTEFRVWRTADGYCGFASLNMPVTLDLVEGGTRNRVEVSAGNAVLIEGEGEGIGVAAEEEEQLVEDNQDLISTFRQSLTEQLAETLNYEELGVEGSRIKFNTTDVAVDADAINTYLDFEIFEKPSDE